MPVATKNSKALATKGLAPKDKLFLFRDGLKNSLVDRDDEVDLVLTALLARQHALLVGPPGTAKSLAVDAVKEWLVGAKKFVVHCCKDTLRSTTFGPVKISALKEDRTERQLDGGAADCHILVLEECYKAGPAVLDTFLLMMNERDYVEGLVHKQTPLISIFGVSNEWSPEGCEAALAAFFDRFLFRKEVVPVRGRDARRELLIKAVANDRCRPVYTQAQRLTLAELEQLQGEVPELPWSDAAKKALWEIVKPGDGALAKEGVQPGDRRLYQSVNAARAYAVLNGAGEVLPEHLEILAHVLWVDPTEQPAKVARAIQSVANPIGLTVTGKLVEVEDVLAKCRPAEAVPKLQEIQRSLQALDKSDPRVAKALGYVSGCIRDTYNSVIGRRDEE